MKIECSKCHDIVESKSLHDFVTCKCGACFVDGGDVCPRAGGPVVMERKPMKIRNKHTGEVVEWEHGLQYKLGREYHSIKEFAEDWEDVGVQMPEHIKKLVCAWLKAQPYAVKHVECYSFKIKGGYVNFFTAYLTNLDEALGWTCVDLDLNTYAPLFGDDMVKFTPEELGLEL